MLTDRRANRIRMLRAIMIAWPKIERIVDTELLGPWIVTISAAGAFRKVL